MESLDYLQKAVRDLLGQPVISRQLTAGASSSNTFLTPTCRRISIRATGGSVRYLIGIVNQTATSASHFIAQDERLDLRVPLNAQIAIIRGGGSDAVLEVSELD